MSFKSIFKKIVGDNLTKKIQKIRFDRANKKLYKRRRFEYYNLSREVAVKNTFKERMGYELDLNNPKTLNEKICWLKVNWYDPKAVICADKYLVKYHVRSKVGEEILVKNYGVWDNPKDIEWDKLPNKFILKTNHGCGGHVICKDKSTLNKKQAIKELKKGFYDDYAPNAQEWTYDNIKPKVICEELLEENEHSPLDYKIFCNNGKVKLLYVCSRHDCANGAKLELNYYDRDFNLYPCQQSYPNISREIKKPVNYEKMIEYAEILSKDFPFVRVDFYNINGKIYFGEFTFFASGGALEFQPEEYDRIFGDMIELPEKMETPFNEKN